MVKLMQCEFLKLKRSNMALISVCGAMVTPFMMLVAIMKDRLNGRHVFITYKMIFSQVNMYMLLLFGLVVYTVFAAFLFSREYSDNTLKTLLTVPVSKTSLLISKFGVLVVWCTLLSSLSWLFCFFVGLGCGAEELSGNILVQSLWESVSGTVLLVFLLTPMIFLSLRTQGIIVPVISSAAIMMLNAALSNEELAALFPWSASFLLTMGTLDATGYPAGVALTIIAATSLGGFLLSLWHFNRVDLV